MAGATIDHLASVIIFIAALLLFISLFNQTIQTAVIYQQHRVLATKCSDLLDTMLLNPANEMQTVFGLHDSNFMQYVLDSFSLMRLNSSTGTPVCYEKTGIMYSNMTVGFDNSLLMPINDSVNPLSNVVNYSSALKLLGIDGAYGFQLTLTPVITFNIEDQRSDNTLELLIDVSGVSFPLANANVNYYLLPVSLNGDYPDFLAEEARTGTVSTNEAGIASVSFTLDDSLTYVFVAYTHVGGLAGVGFYVPPSGSQKPIPFVESLNGTVLLAHSSDVLNTTSSGELNYTSAFVKLSNENFELQNIATGEVGSGAGHDPQVINVPNYAGILVIAYKNGNGTAGGVAVMPWGVGSLAFPVAFGGNPAQQEWVATDVRQVLVNGVAYQAKLSLWSLQGVQVVG